MNKVAEFYAKAMADEATAAEFAEAMGGKAMNELGDAEFEKLGKLAEKLGFTISVEEAKEYLSPKEGELADDELDAVAGGGARGSKTMECVHCGTRVELGSGIEICPNCGKIFWE